MPYGFWWSALITMSPDHSRWPQGLGEADVRHRSAGYLPQRGPPDVLMAWPP